MEAESPSHEIIPVTKSTLSEKLSLKKSLCCSICGRCFRGVSTLSRHQRIHTGEKPFSCTVCLKCFRTNDHLSDHKRIHTGEKPHCCSVCVKSFKQKSQLLQHERLHTGERPYCCSICGRSFSRGSHLSQHKKSHTHEKPLSCNICGKCFSQKSHLSRHIKTHTDEEVSSATDSSSSDMPQGQMNESKATVNYVGISPKESFGDLSVKEEFDSEEFDPALESSVKEKFNPLEGSTNKEIDSLKEEDSLEIKEETISSGDETSSNL